MRIFIYYTRAAFEVTLSTDNEFFYRPSIETHDFGDEILGGGGKTRKQRKGAGCGLGNKVDKLLDPSLMRSQFTSKLRPTLTFCISSLRQALSKKAEFDQENDHLLQKLSELKDLGVTEAGD